MEEQKTIKYDNILKFLNEVAVGSTIDISFIKKIELLIYKKLPKKYRTFQNAEDILQESALAYYNALKSGTQINYPATYFSTIAINKSIDFIRKESKTTTINIDNISNLVFDQPSLLTISGDLDSIKKLFRETKKDKRFLRQHRLYLLYRYYDMSNKEIRKNLRVGQNRLYAMKKEIIELFKDFVLIY